MYDKIKAQLKKQFPGVSEKALEAIAKRLAKRVTEETAIEGAITEFDGAVGVQDFANDLQAEGDRRVTEAQKKKPNEQQQQQQEPKKEDEDMPAWAKQLSDTVKSLATQKQRDSIQDILNKKLEEKKIPLVMAKGRLAEKEEDIDSLVTEIEAVYTAVKQGAVNETAAANTTKVIGGNVKSETIDADIAAWSKNNQSQKEAGKP